MGRHNKANKERKAMGREAKAREEKETKAKEEQKLPEISKNVATVKSSTSSLAHEASAANSISFLASSPMIPTSVEAKFEAVELAQATEYERLQETFPINEKASGSCRINETAKESDWENEANDLATKTEEPPRGWAQFVSKSEEASSTVRLQPSSLDARHRPLVEGSNPGENKGYSAGPLAQTHSGGWGDNRTTGNGRVTLRGGYGDQAGYSAQSHSGRSGDFRTAGNGRGGSSGGYGGRQAAASEVDDFTRIDSLGRLLSYILRHQAEELRLNMRSDGYVLVKDLLNLRKRTNAGLPLSSHTVDDIKEAVRRDNKQRFGLREENGELFIRANQGHSIKAVKSEALLCAICHTEEVPVCVHGTYLRYLDAIKKEGLKRMSRNHVHFATGLFKEKSVISGMRSNCEVLIYLDVQKYLKDGMKLYRSENGVILAEGKNGVIPPEYFAKIERVRS